MKRHLLTGMALAALLLLASGCGEDREVVTPSGPDGTDAAIGTLDPELAAQEVMAVAGWAIEPGREEALKSASPTTAVVPVCVADFSRTLISGDIAHYAWRVRVGAGPYDVIGLHRVVRERRPGIPVHVSKSIFLQHGSSKEFVGMFLPGLYSPTTPDDFGFAVYLARNGIDVWGIDQSWTLVPADEQNLDFMADWGLERQVRDLRTGVTVARLVRLLTGSGNAKLILAGYSNGIPTTISLVNDETQLPPGLRQIGGYIPFDCPIRVAPGSLRDVLVYYSELYQSFVDAGGAAEPVLFAPMAELVRCCPDEPSPFDPSLTNLQYALLFSAGAVLFPGETFHYWAGVLDQTGMPTDVRFTPHELWLDFLASGTAYEPYIWTVDWTGYVAGTLDTTHDDHLAEIRVPVLNVTPGGGFGDNTLYGLSLLGSTDVQTLMPTTGLPPAEEYAHIDLFTYAGSEHLVWEPVLNWIRDHTPGGARQTADEMAGNP